MTATHSELAEVDKVRPVSVGEGISQTSGLGSLQLSDFTSARKMDKEPITLTFDKISGYDAPITKQTLIASDRVDTFSEAQNVYNRALADMVKAGHHLSGGDFASGIGNILQNSGLSKDTWVCAEQADYLATQLSKDSRLNGSEIFLINTGGDEHQFVGLRGKDGRMIFMDPWREKGPSYESPNQVDHYIRFSR